MKKSTQQSKRKGRARGEHLKLPLGGLASTCHLPSGVYPHTNSRRFNLLRRGRSRELVCGFTLLETVVALAIIVSGVVGAFSLALTGVMDASVGKNKLIAINLAQEGIELVRKIRDDNELSGNANWIDYLFPTLDPACLHSWKIDIFTTTGPLVPYDVSPLNYDSSTGVYSYNVSAPPSIFTRKIDVVKPTCAMPDKRVIPMPGGFGTVPDNAQMEVFSTVSWNERSVPKSIVLQEVFFDWK